MSKRAVILAGGKSSRFGSDKSRTKLGNKTLIEHTISKIEKDFLEILIISTKKEYRKSKKNIFVIESKFFIFNHNIYYIRFKILIRICL